MKELALRQVGWLLCLGMLALAGCRASVPGLRDFTFQKRPTAAVAEVTLVSQSDEGAVAEIAVELANPNPQFVPLPKVHYRMEVEGVGTFNFTDAPARMLPAEGAQILVLPAAFAANDAVTGKSYRVSGSVSWEATGQVREFLVESGFPLPKTHFAGEGVLQ